MINRGGIEAQLHQQTALLPPEIIRVFILMMSTFHAPKKPIGVVSHKLRLRHAQRCCFLPGNDGGLSGGFSQGL